MFQDERKPGSFSYEVILEGHVSPAYWEDFRTLTATMMQDGTTVLHISNIDQPALYGLLATIRDLGVSLVGVKRLSGEEG